MIKGLTFIVVTLGLSLVTFAQDIVFSQFEQVATYYNPAYAGFDREIGGGINVRNQWGNTNGDYFYSYVFGDAFFEHQRSGVGIDLSYSSANSGAHTVVTTGARYNYHLELNKTWKSSVGLSASYASVQLNEGKLLFEDQIINGNSVSTSENIQSIENRGYLDLGVGTVFYVQEKTELGLGIKHVNFPKLNSLNSEKTSVKPMINIYLKHRKLIAGSVYRPNSKKVYLVPSLFLVNQASFNQMKLGSAVEIELVQFGLYYRGWLGKLDGQYGRNDAMVLMAGLKTDSFNMTYTYDLNIAAQRIATSSHELSLIYVKKSYGPKALKPQKRKR